ncbi:DUF3237 domain-containing protein [Sphingomonas bacterium]|uniref:DUF3237 domain-containing protein n=1 Tax=Sphingomonas bacterium TaxID=1895847 RepID=UPI001575183D|nr:DUF3237 domain-containing protein [Sphingomonas bacterium]
MLALLAAVLTGAQTPPAEPSIAPPRLTYVFTIEARLGLPQEQGEVDGRRTRFVPITGGRVHGPRLSGVVLAGGGDWQAIHRDGLTEINTRYSLRVDDGTVIDIVNPGVRTADPAVVARMARGEDVDPSLYYFRTAPRMTVADGPHAWLRRTVFVGRGIRRSDRVEIEVFAVE